MQDSVQLLTLLRWGLAALIDAARRLKLHEGELQEWEDVLENLAPYSTDPKIGLLRPTPCFHPSDYMCSIYPLHLLSIHNPKEQALINTTLDYWLEHSKKIPLWDREGGGWRLTHGAACLAAAGRGETALKLLHKFIKVRMTPNTMYREGDSPTVETPISGCAALYEMLMQSWGGICEYFPQLPELGRNVHSKTCGPRALFLSAPSAGKVKL